MVRSIIAQSRIRNNEKFKMRSRPEDPVYRYVVKRNQKVKVKKSAKIAGLNKFYCIYYDLVTELYKKYIILYKINNFFRLPIRQSICWYANIFVTENKKR